MQNVARRDKVGAFWVLLFSTLVAIIASQIGSPAPLRAQTAPAQATAAQTQTAKTKVNPKDGLTYVFIPAGTFQMGCSPNDSDCMDLEKPAHSVTISQGFWIGQTLVTQVAYKKVMNANPSTFLGDQLPAETMPWGDAQSYCSKVDMRLPTEAEWEYAARGGNPTARYGALDTIAWWSGNSKGEIHPVAQKQANAYGLFDMLGNAWEWVADWFAPYTAAAATDPKGPATGTAKLLRGSSRTGADSAVRVSARNWTVPDRTEDFDYSFRCASN